MLKIIACITILAVSACAPSMGPANETPSLDGDMLIDPASQPTGQVVVN